jgi:hypothetical protein
MLFVALEMFYNAGVVTHDHRIGSSFGEAMDNFTPIFTLVFVENNHLSAKVPSCAAVRVRIYY